MVCMVFGKVNALSVPIWVGANRPSSLKAFLKKR